MSETPIDKLIKQIEVGDEDALIQLHEEFSTPVYSVAYRVLGNKLDAEEVTQDVFMKLWDKAYTFDSNKGKFISWILTITRRSAIDRLRKRDRREPPENSVSMDAEPYLWETKLGSEDMSDVQRSLLSVMGQLPQDQAQAIYLSYFHGMSHSDIAAHLDRPLGTVKSHIRLGMQKLRDIWTQPTTTIDSERRYSS
ncbi:MAG: sigma-70 family RNA polymerase sigma factor [Phototrophicaceae bacterium]